MALDGSPFLIAGYPVIEREQHGREETVLDVVQVEGAHLSVELDVVRGPHIIRQAVVEDAGLVRFDLIDGSGLGAVFHIPCRVLDRSVAALPHP